MYATAVYPRRQVNIIIEIGCPSLNYIIAAAYASDPTRLIKLGRCCFFLLAGVLIWVIFPATKLQINNQRSMGAQAEPLVLWRGDEAIVIISRD